MIFESDVITMDTVNKVLNDSEQETEEIQIASLKLAKQELEISMVKRAYENLRSFYKVAEALGITQPAVMKILKRNGYHLKIWRADKNQIAKKSSRAGR